jgi:hypothetical protein
MTPPSSQREHNDRHRRTARPALQARYRRLYDELLEILIRLDPLGVHSTQPSALAPEVASILARLREARVADDVERIVLEELHRWYAAASSQLWIKIGWPTHHRDLHGVESLPHRR